MADTIDLHTHSTCSDGVDLPEEVVRIASERGLRAIALTDHDSLSGVEKAQMAAKRYGIEVVSGVEISSELGKYADLHIVGLFVEPRDVGLLYRLRKVTISRHRRLRKILHELNHLLRKDGLTVSISEGDIDKTCDSVGQPHIAHALIRSGAVSTRNEAFSKYLDKIRVAKEYVPAAEAVWLIREAGGVSVLAHPFDFLRFKLPGNREKKGPDLVPDLLDLLDACKRCGVDGLEVYHPANTEEDVQILSAQAIQLGMCISGGSDYHGEHPWDRMSPEIHPGTVPYDILVDLKALIYERV